MQKNCEHGLTEILDTGEGVDGSGVALVVRIEACRLCGQRRTVTERNGEKYEDGVRIETAEEVAA